MVGVTAVNADRRLISHLSPGCICDHRPGDPCNASCPVHLGAGLRSAEGDMYEPAENTAREFAALAEMIREQHPRAGDTRVCPCGCGRVQRYTGTEHGWVHEAVQA